MIFSWAWVDEWPPLGKELLILLTIYIFLLYLFVILVVSFLVFASDYTSSWPVLTLTFQQD